MKQYILTEDGLAELEKYFMEHKDDLFKIAWKNFKDKAIRPYDPQTERDIEQLKKAIIEVLDTGFESSERDMMLVIDRIEAWEKGELRQEGTVSEPVDK